MKILVCGGRDFDDYELLYTTLDLITYGQNDVIIIEGDARGADKMAGQWAKERGHRLEVFPAEWGKFGNRAGPIRNQQMLNEGPDLVIAFPGGRGTAHMVGISKKAGVKVIEVGK